MLTFPNGLRIPYVAFTLFRYGESHVNRAGGLVTRFLHAEISWRGRDNSPSLAWHLSSDRGPCGDVIAMRYRSILGVCPRRFRK